MRRSFVAGVGVIAALSVAGTAAASAPTKKPPVKLSGKVNNKGTAKVQNGAITLEEHNYFYKATFVQGTKGAKVAVTINNTSGTQHTFTIPSQHIDKTVDPGKSVTVTVKIPANGKPAPGYCRFHHDLGMQFAFFSKAGGSASSGSSKSTGGSGYGY